MSGKMRTEIISRKCIKPSSPTPPDLRFFKFSLLDQLSPNIHGNMTFFYPHLAGAATHGGGSAGDDVDVLSQFSFKSQLLQNSLSQTLTRFYPLAGRFHDAATIDCNDDGAFYVESRTDATLSHFLRNPDFDTTEHHFLATADTETMGSSNGAIFLVRFTLFGCGGTAVSVSLNHKIVDLATMLTVLQSWTATCRSGVKESPNDVVHDLCLGASLFPPREIPGISASVNIPSAGKFTARRFLFSASNVGELKRRVVTALQADVDNPLHFLFQFHPTRVEVVLALIWICAMCASRAKTGLFKPSALFQAVNLRSRMDPPVPETAIGNFVWPFAVNVEKDEELELHCLVKKMREGMKEFVDKEANKFREGGGFEAVMEFLKKRSEMLKKEEGIVVYKCSSWCRYPLLEVDYGWGNPVWRTSVNRIVSNTIALLDVGDGGVEALITLDEQEMDLFEKNQELLQYAVVNPSIFI